ncbi:MAG: hypothetical protein MUF15_20780, partial [Acidobacteria bacterium]|nr:hypothetical protein [Acidobacteriota bacterium]
FNYNCNVIEPTFSLNLPERIIIQSTPKFQSLPLSFCATEDNVFLITDTESEEIKIFENTGSYLRYERILKLDRFPLKKKTLPIYCYYSRNEQNQGKLGIIDEGLRKIFIFHKNGKFDFSLKKEVDCEKLGYDLKFTTNGEQLIVSGFKTDGTQQHFDLFSINLKSGKIGYILPSYEKYKLKNPDDYNVEYIERKTLPAIGIKAFFDIQRDDIFFVWEGDLRIIKLNLRSKDQKTFGYQPCYYKKPDARKLVSLYKENNMDELQNVKKTMAYVRAIFANSRHIFLIYETDISKSTDGSRFRLQMYTLTGHCLGDISIPGTPGQPMWLDKGNYELYAFSQQEKPNNSSFTILKYKIKI